MNKKRHKNKVMILIVLFSIYGLITLMPIWYVLVNSFKELDYIYRRPLAFVPEAFTVRAFVDTFQIMQFPRILMNNIQVLILSISMMIALGSTAAYGIVMGKNKLMTGIYVFMVLIITIPIQLIMIPLVVQFRDLGLINSFLGLSIFFTAFSIPLVVFLYVGYMKTIPYEIYEAAVVDGCGFFKTFLVIYLPLLKVVTGTILIVRGVFVWNFLLIPLIMITDPRKSLLVLRLYLFTGPWATGWDKLFAGTLLVSLPIAILFLLLQKQFISGITMGSVKG